MGRTVLANVGAPPLQQPGSTLRVGLLGFGTVGSCVAEVLAAQADGGLQITHVFNREVARKQGHERARYVPAGAMWTENAMEILGAPDVDLVVELVGGLQPAEEWVRTALGAGKHVVTANKQLIAQHGPALCALAQAKNVQLLYGAAVAGGVPVLPGMAQGLCGDHLSRLSGIVNGTCNFILSAMETGAEYAEALRQAQGLGYAEADPSADVDGHDARAKLCILARLALGVEMPLEAVPAHTIARVAAVDFAYAQELGCTVRQVSQVQREQPVPPGELMVRARVGPMLVPRSSPMAWSHGTQNMVVSSGTFGGDVVLSGHGAGGHPTAVAVVSDLLAVACGSYPVQRQAQPVQVSGDALAPHYLRFIVRDRPGIIAAIAGALAGHHVNIDSILQRRGFPEERLPFVVTTEPCLRSVLDAAVAEMGTLDAFVEPPLVLPILVVDDPDLD